MLVRTWASVVIALLTAVPVWAADDGQADLDQATETKLAAQTLADLEKVTQLCESALQKGLEPGSEQFAKQLLTSTLYQIASKLSSAIFEQETPDPRWPVLRQAAVENLQRALRYDSELGEAHYLIARLESLPGGDRQRALKSANAAVKLLAADNQQLSKALLLRGNLSDDGDQRLADYQLAIQTDPNNHDALRTRGLYYLTQGQPEKAVADFTAVLDEDAENVDAHEAIAEALTNMQKYDEALEHLSKSIKLSPDNSLGYTLRARVHALQGDLKAAMEDLDTALKADPNDVAALLMRARLRQTQGESELARADIERVLVVRPGLTQAIVLRSLLAAASGDMAKAISDMQDLVDKDPRNVEWRLQLAALYSRDQRPRKAVALYSEVLDENPSNALALSGRADTLLSIGKHTEAVEDYDRVLKLSEPDSNVLNNLAWVLATSPDENVRNGERAIELATKACELTEYKRPHILSTLAAGYAESGDFETAIKWSSKAVELGDKELKQQLTEELESYRQKKPWREKQQMEERPDPGPRGGAFEP
jgi:tetratricopeptide (TPR) repeat protein